MTLQNRKSDHIRLTVDNQSAYSYDAGFSKFRFVHNALPELNLYEISTEATLLGRTFSIPLFISSMTGGFAGATQVNEIIASVCEEFNIPFGIGSQRALLDYPDTIKSFSVVREIAPNAFIAGNIGGAQLVGSLNRDKINTLVESIRADALIVHLNPLQELMQAEGDRNFKGILDGIAHLVANSPVPIIVKETGAGITYHVARQLFDIGVELVDVAGAGGTSWAKVENLRKTNAEPLNEFNDWGIPTTTCLYQLKKAGIPSHKIIASGGIRSAHDTVKSLCLGAGFAATAQPVISAIDRAGRKGLSDLIHNWRINMAYTMLLTGCSHVDMLNSDLLFTENQYDLR
jgi:isopentenyl-diphosphate delta-isomerase